ncbi:hypothetical protein EZJ43_08850 [Pedobacter changchengzhani]|uniref:Outer membrane protein beta-barrel domain-containing protein n=1 Tax=Pedobacter changchengzhani TaxID=2529274 RepID=A0A4R5MLT9_9SPHI|nr:hypothetical protein [Pedobacter changchengzhani]TDG36608.1 hypothetical protein EZJ43_08850 [Pedobacter changchengzhani]
MDKELIDEIKDSLLAHEEAYKPGAWEQFSAQNAIKPKFIYWPLWAAAVIVLILGTLLYVGNEHKTPNGTNNMIVKVKSSNTQPKVKKGTTEIILEKLNVASNNPIPTKKRLTSISIQNKAKLNFKNTLMANPAVAIEKQSADLTSELEQRDIIASNAPNNKLAEEKTAVPVPNDNVAKPTASATFEKLLATDSKNNLVKAGKNKTVNKWQQDIYVAPSMGNDNKLNMNYGFSLSYSIAKKLSLSSGIAYSALSTKGGLPNSPSAPMNMARASALPTNTKNLESIDANLKGINIPLALKYSISDKFYTGLGISAFATIKNDQQNNYIVTETKNTSVVSTLGIAEQKMLVQTNQVSEKQTENEVINDKYLGFYNFSLGYKQKISSKKNIAIEPFLNVPMKDFSSENLNLTNGGLRFKFEF